MDRLFNPEKYTHHEDDDEEVDENSTDVKTGTTSSKKKSTKPAAFFAQDKTTPKSTEAQDAEKHQRQDDLERMAEAGIDALKEEQTLTESELHEVLADLITEREPEVLADLIAAASESPDELAVIARAAYLAELRDRVESSEEVTEDTLDAVFDDTVADLDLVDSDQQSTALTFSHASGQHQPAFTPQSTVTHGQHWAAAYPNTTPQPATTHSLHQAAAGYPNATLPPSTHNVIPTHNNHNTHSTRVGLVLGSVIARRGGRKRANQKVAARTDALQAQIGKLNSAIAHREQKISQLAYNYAHKQALLEGSAAAKQLAVLQRAEQLQAKRQQRADQLLQTQLRERIENTKVHEKIGPLKLSALEIFVERRRFDSEQHTTKRKPVEIMTERELLEKIGKLEIDGMPVFLAYKEQRISLYTLREVTKLYLRSGDYERVFRRELRASLHEMEKHRATLHESYEKQSQQREGYSVTESARNTTHTQSGMNRVERPVVKSRPITPLVAAVVFGCIIIILLLLSYA